MIYSGEEMMRFTSFFSELILFNSSHFVAVICKKSLAYVPVVSLSSRPVTLHLSKVMHCLTLRKPWQSAKTTAKAFIYYVRVHLLDRRGKFLLLVQDKLGTRVWTLDGVFSLVNCVSQWLCSLSY